MRSTAAEMGRPTILVVEDDELIRAMASDVLEDAGYDVLAVAAAEDALGLAVMDVPFDALFTDINLGSGLDGWELADALREMRPGLPVVYTSGEAINRDPAGRVEASLFLPKPYNPVALCALFKGLTGARRPTPVPDLPVRNSPAPEYANRAPGKAELRLIA
ncbi:MAG TPA: response regulator [Xanthobacteraceae bacterium]|nr:response regulator [Xanthobacteraceae bacterium]